jgi:hypothetical protein
MEQVKSSLSGSKDTTESISNSDDSNNSEFDPKEWEERNAMFPSPLPDDREFVEKLLSHYQDRNNLFIHTMTIEKSDIEDIKEKDNYHRFPLSVGDIAIYDWMNTGSRSEYLVMNRQPTLP